MDNTKQHTKPIFNEQEVRQVLQTVTDPEVPVLSVTDLGIVREVKPGPGNEGVEIVITPTYSGCPAMDVIARDIRNALSLRGFNPVKITTVLSPAWTTEWMTEAGKEKLKAWGIAPPNPVQQVCQAGLFLPNEGVQCPRCNSWHTHRVSEFGSTPCKALYRCDDCSEPFDYFKCH